MNCNAVRHTTAPQLLSASPNACLRLPLLSRVVPTHVRHPDYVGYLLVCLLVCLLGYCVRLLPCLFRCCCADAGIDG